jgi:hypothetical protein
MIVRSDYAWLAAKEVNIGSATMTETTPATAQRINLATLS